MGGGGACSGRALAGWERRFFRFPPCRAQPLKRPKAIATRTNGRRTFPAERPLPQPRAQGRGIPGTGRRGRGDEPHLGRSAKLSQEAAGDRPHLQGWEPSHPPGSGRPSARGKLRLGCAGVNAPKPQGRGQRWGGSLDSPREKRGRQRRGRGAQRIWNTQIRLRRSPSGGLRSKEEAASGKGTPKRNSPREGARSPTCAPDPGPAPRAPGIRLLGV